jgi:hypothetical protein
VKYPERHSVEKIPSVMRPSGPLMNDQFKSAMLR